MRKVTLYVLLTSLLSSCITEYTPKGIDELSQLLVVEGYISEGTSEIRLSKSVSINNLMSETKYINDAKVAVESESGVIYSADSEAVDGLYKVQIEKMEPTTKYRLKLSAEGKEYESAFTSPMPTPDIDKLYWEKNKATKEVNINAMVQSTGEQPQYYAWNYQEIWEFTVPYYKNFTYDENGEVVFYDEHFLFNPIQYCWIWNTQDYFILSSTENLQGNSLLRQNLLNTIGGDERFSILYYIKVNLQMLSKEAFEYYSNLQNNMDEAGGIFDPMPSQLEGNIYCTSNPEIPVIGYVEASYIRSKEMFITREKDDVYDPVGYNECQTETDPIMVRDCFPWLELFYIRREPWEKDIYTYRSCFDCTRRGTKNKPDFWPNDHK